MLIFGAFGFLASLSVASDQRSSGKSERTEIKEDTESGVKGDLKGGVKELSDIQEVIIKEMLFNPSFTTSEMAQKTGIKFRTLQRQISQLQAMGGCCPQRWSKRWLLGGC